MTNVVHQVKHPAGHPRRVSLPRFLPVLTAAVAVAASAASGETLQTKTLNGETYSPTEDSTIGTLTVATGSAGNVLAVGEGITLTVDSYLGGGRLRKTGAGTLVVRDIDSAADVTVGEGKILFAKSAGVATLTSAAAVHLDASDLSTITVASSDGSTAKITKWTDVHGADDHAWAIYPTDWWRECYPRYRFAAQNGLNYVDLRTSATSDAEASFLHMGNFQGTDAEGVSSGYGNDMIGVKGVKEIFLIVKDQPANGRYQAFLGDLNNNWNYFFRRGADGRIWDQSVAETDGLRKGKTWVDGNLVSSSSVFPEGFHLLRARSTTATHRFSALGRYCTPASLPESFAYQGGIAYGEVIVFKQDVDDAVADEMTRRLMHKWFGSQTVAALVCEPGGAIEVASGERVRVPLTNGGAVEYHDGVKSLVLADGETCTIAEDADYADVSTAGTGAKLAVAQGATVTVGWLSGSKTLEKIGEGTLVVKDVDSETAISAQEGLVDLTASGGAASLDGAAALHLDASAEDTFTFKTIGSDTRRITKWTDVRNADAYPWMAQPGWGGVPQHVKNGQNGLGVVRSFPATANYTAGGFLFAGNLTGTDAESVEGIKNVREVFMIVKDEPGTTSSGGPLYQSFLGDKGASWHCAWKRATGTGALWNEMAETAPIRNGKSWIDGQLVSATNVFPSGFHLLRARTSEASRFSTLGYEREQVNGGLYFGELLVFKQTVDDETAERLSNNLMHKWFGRQSMATLTVGANGAVAVKSGESVAVDACQVARLDVTVGEGLRLQPKTVTVADAGVAVVRVPDGVRLHSRMEVPLMTAGEGIVNASAFESGWTVSCVNSARELKPKVVGNTLVAYVEPTGLHVLVK